MKNMNIEAEGSELILKNKAGDYVIIPKRFRREVQDMIKDNCHSCIDALVEKLPVMEDYAEDGSVINFGLAATKQVETPDFVKSAPQTIDEGYSTIDKYYKKYNTDNAAPVRSIQRAMIKKGYLQPGQADGKFGDITKSAYEKYITDKANRQNQSELDKAKPWQSPLYTAPSTDAYADFEDEGTMKTDALTVAPATRTQDMVPLDQTWEEAPNLTNNTDFLKKTPEALKKEINGGCVAGICYAHSRSKGVSEAAWRSKNNMYGDAWTIFNNMYGDDVEFGDGDYSNLKPNDFVSLSRAGFKSDEEKGIPTYKDKEGKVLLGKDYYDQSGITQHVGEIIDRYTPEGVPYVRHYVGNGKFLEEPFNNMSQFANYTPRRVKRLKSDKKITLGRSNFKFDEGYEPNAIEEGFVSGSLEKPTIQSVLRLDNEEYDDLERLAYGIMGTESDFGRSARTAYRMAMPEILQKAIKPNHDENLNALSKGYGSLKKTTTEGVGTNRDETWREANKRMKEGDFSDMYKTTNALRQYLVDLGVDINDLDSPEDSYKATMATLAWLKNRFPNATDKELMAKYTGRKNKALDTYEKKVNQYLGNIDKTKGNEMQFSTLDQFYGAVSNLSNIAKQAGQDALDVAATEFRRRSPLPANVNAIIADIAGAKGDITAEDLSPTTMNALRSIIKNNVEKGKMYIEYNDYFPELSREEALGGVGGTTNKMSSWDKIKRNITPEGILQSTFGQATIVDLGNGVYELRDTYDFNDQGKSFGVIDDMKKRGPSPYNLFRSLGRNYGSADGMGAEVHIKVKI